MQDATTQSLNAVRVFIFAARAGSLKTAAKQLNVTPGAVSQQVRQLERRLGTQLFVRRNNAIDLTPAGQRLLQTASPGLDQLHAALAQATRNANSLHILCSMTFASRWLIPRLETFKHQNRTADIQLTTTLGIDDTPPTSADIVIGYYRTDRVPPHTDILFTDACRPYLSPACLARHGTPDNIPALQCAADNWDWQLWCTGAQTDFDNLKFASRFDLDDSALRAATNGMGMVLTSAFMVADELETNRLCPLPGSPEIPLGAYTLHATQPDTPLTRRFRNWLVAAASKTAKMP